MKKKNGTYVDHGFGFPIKIENLPLELDESLEKAEWIPDMDLSLLQADLFEKLITYEGNLTGNHIRFIRLHLGLTLEKFGVFAGGFTHQAVMKWEKNRENPAGMDWHNELNLRLQMALTLDMKPDRLKSVCVNLVNKSKHGTPTITLDASTVAVYAAEVSRLMRCRTTDKDDGTAPAAPRGQHELSLAA